MSDWNLIEEVGGAERLEALMREFYDLLFDDVIVGFLFQGKDKEHLIRSQIEYVTANLGDRRGTYEGKSIRAAHAHLPILPGQFDRRHVILEQVLERHGVPEHVRREWLALDASLRPLVLNLGAATRDRLPE